MNVIVGCVLGMFVIADLAALVRLRRQRNEAAQAERIKRSLEFAVRREIEPGDPLPPEGELEPVNEPSYTAT